jgi:hypothetical protein
VEEFKYFRTTLRNQYYIHEEVDTSLKSDKFCYNSVQKFYSSNLRSKNIKIKVYRTTISPVVLYGWETWSLTLREEYRLRVFENKLQRRIFASKRDNVTGEWRKLHIEELYAF